jgi:hypothetical protein
MIATVLTTKSTTAVAIIAMGVFILTSLDGQFTTALLRLEMRLDCGGKAGRKAQSWEPRQTFLKDPGVRTCSVLACTSNFLCMTSALPPKADINMLPAFVSDVPNGDIR